MSKIFLAPNLFLSEENSGERRERKGRKTVEKDEEVEKRENTVDMIFFLPPFFSCLVHSKLIPSTTNFLLSFPVSPETLPKEAGGKEWFHALDQVLIGSA